MHASRRLSLWATACGALLLTAVSMVVFSTVAAQPVAAQSLIETEQYVAQIGDIPGPADDGLLPDEQPPPPGDDPATTPPENQTDCDQRGQSSGDLTFRPDPDGGGPQTASCAPAAAAPAGEELDCPEGYAPTPGPEGDRCTAPVGENGECPPGGQIDPNDENVCVADTENIKCSAESALSWILCPLLEIAIKGSQQLGNILNDLLFVSPLDRNDTENGGDLVYQVWSNIRNFANVLFIFALFAILYSQATSVGMSAYGVKRALPKLVAGAILANLSFFLCAIAVDMFNVLGGGINGLVDAAMQVPIGTVPGGNIPGILNSAAVVGILATVGVVIIFLSGAWSLVLLLLFVAVLTLVARQALIIILVIAAPIAFAAWVLPNTEQYFSQWFKLFFSALLMYPLVIMVLAGSRLAASVFASTGDNSALRITLGILIAFLPMLALPALFKVGSYSLSKIGNMARGSAVGKGVEGFGKRKQDNLEARMANNQWANSGKRWQRGIGKGMRGVGNYKNRRQFKIDRQAEMAKRLQDDTTAGAVAGSSTDSRFGMARQAAGPAGRQGAGLIQARALEQQEKTDQEYIAASRKAWELKYPKDMNSMKQELLAGASSGKLSNTEIQGGLSRMLNGGGPGRAAATDVYSNEEFMEGFAGEAPEKAAGRYHAAMKIASDQDFGVFDDKLSHMAGQVAAYEKPQLGVAGSGSVPQAIDRDGAAPVKAKDSNGNLYTVKDEVSGKIKLSTDGNWSGAESRKMLTGDGTYGGALQTQISTNKQAILDRTKAAASVLPSQQNLELTIKSPQFASAHIRVQDGVKQALALYDPRHELL